MANYPYKKVGVQLDKIRNDVNENFVAVENDFMEVKATNDNLQQQVNNLVVEGDSSPQAQQASVGADGTNYNGNLKARLDSEYNKVTAQLATTGEQVTQIEMGERFDINDKGRYAKSLISFIDDDCRSQTYTKLFPIVKDLNIPYALACETSYIDRNTYMTLGQLIEMYKHPNISIASHQNDGNIAADVATEDEYEANLLSAKSWFLQNGITDTYLLAYVQGKSSPIARKVATRYHRGAFGTTEGVNFVPYYQYLLRRVALGHYNSTPANSPITGLPIGSLAHTKKMVDRVVSSGGWLVFYTHAWYEQFSESDLRELVAYIREKGIPIVSPNEALNKTGNVVQVGDFIPDSYNDEVMVVGSNGSSVVGRKFGNYINAYQNSYTTTMLPSSFPLEKTTVCRVNGTIVTGAPVDEFGVLTTIASGVVANTFRNYEFIHQTYMTQSGKLFKRVSNSTGTAWGNWEPIASNIINYSDPNIFNKPLSTFSVGMTISRVPDAESAGFPQAGTGGTLTTVKVDTNTNNSIYSYQEYIIKQSGTKYVRSAGLNDTWMPFKQVTN